MQILFRKSFDSFNELNIAKNYCEVREHRSDCNAGQIVIGRYSVLPYYQELEADLAKINTKLINTYSQHCWIADFQYYNSFKAYTFPSWNDVELSLIPYDGPLVVKGRTNSRKHRWDTLMYAENKEQARYIADMLYADPLLAEQGIIFRQYVPLETFEIGINGQPFTNEWRFFFLGTKLLTYGYYWSQAIDAEEHVLEESGINFAKEMAKIASNYVNFFVVDIAKTAEGRWMLVELNDGQMSGLSMCPAEQLYNGLKNEYQNH